MKYIDSIRDNLSQERFPVFSIRDVKTMLASRKARAGYVYLLLHNLMKRKEVTRVTKGVYTFHRNMHVVGFAFEPFYYGMEDALTIRGLWGQQANPVIVTARKARNGIRIFRDRNYVLHRIDPDHFFGYELLKHEDIWIPVSDPEKTLIDFFYFRRHLENGVLKILLRLVDGKKLDGYLKRYDRRFAGKVIRSINQKTRADAEGNRDIHRHEGIAQQAASKKRTPPLAPRDQMLPGKSRIVVRLMTE